MSRYWRRYESHWGWTRKIEYVPRKDGPGYTRQTVWVPWTMAQNIAALLIFAVVAVLFVAAVIFAVTVQ